MVQKRTIRQGTNGYLHAVTENGNSRQYHVKQSIAILEQNLLHIRNVGEWSQAMGYSRSHFCRIFSRHFGEKPKIILRKARFNMICKSIHSNWSATAYRVAVETGFTNEKSLHKFLLRHYNTRFLLLRNRLKCDAFRSRKKKNLAAEKKHQYAGSFLKRYDFSDMHTRYPGQGKTER